MCHGESVRLVAFALAVLGGFLGWFVIVIKVIVFIVDWIEALGVTRSAQPEYFRHDLASLLDGQFQATFGRQQKLDALTTRQSFNIRVPNDIRAILAITMFLFTDARLGFFAVLASLFTISLE